MGIKGLLGSLKPYVEPVHVSKYAGQRVGIDCYSWLHKGAYACSRELLESGGLITGPRMPAYIAYCAHRIQMLKHYMVVPVVVFDGARLPMKAGTEAERRRNKSNSLEEARAKLAAGDERGAEEAFQRSVDITPHMALQVMKYLRKEGVDFIVAPYEADAQLAALASAGKENGGIAAVITEDSDLLAYGCSTVLYKMDKYGNAEEISTERLFSSIGPGSQGPPGQASSGRQQGGTCLSFRRFNQELFLGMCILAGCDFLPSIPGIGIAKAHAVVNKYRNLDRALSRLKLDAKLAVPPGYAREYARARATFAHARVYDPASKRLVHLNPLPQGFAEGFGGDIDFLGPLLRRSRSIQTCNSHKPNIAASHMLAELVNASLRLTRSTARDMSPSTARAIAEGRVNPLTMEAFARTDADTWLTRVPRAGGTWQGPSGQQGATWRSGKSPKRTKGSPRRKSPPAGIRPAFVDLDTHTDPSFSGRPEPEAPPRPRPPATVDLSAFRNLAVPRSRGLGVDQPSTNPSEAGSLNPNGLVAEEVRLNGSPERNRTAFCEKNSGFSRPGEESAMAGFDGNEPPDVSMEESEDVLETRREPRQQPRQQEREPVPARPILSDLPRNPFKRWADEPAGGTSWVRQLTIIAPQSRKPLSSKAPGYSNPFAARARGADEGKRFRESKVSPFFAKPGNPPSKPPSDTPLNSSPKSSANPSSSVVPEPEAVPGNSVPSGLDRQETSPCQSKRPRSTGVEAAAELHVAPPAPVPVACSPETSVPFFGPSLDSDPGPRPEFDSQGFVPSTPSEELEPGEPLNVPRETCARGLEEKSLEGLQSTWAVTAASQAAADAGRQRTDSSGREPVPVRCAAEVGWTSATGFDGVQRVQREREETDSAGAAETEGRAAPGQAFDDSNSSGVPLQDGYVAAEKRMSRGIPPSVEAAFDVKGDGTVGRGCTEEVQLEEHTRKRSDKRPVDTDGDCQEDPVATDQFEQSGGVGIRRVENESVQIERVEASVEATRVAELTVLNGLIDLESVELRGPASLLQFPRPMVPRRQTVKPSSILNFFRPAGDTDGAERGNVKRPRVEAPCKGKRSGQNAQKKRKKGR